MSRSRPRLSASQRPWFPAKSLISFASQRRVSASSQRASAFVSGCYRCVSFASQRVSDTPPLLRRGGRGPEPPPLHQRKGEDRMSQPFYFRDATTGFMPGFAIPEFASKREEVRWKVRHLNLSAMDRATRQAAAADPAIVWDEATRQYRSRRRSDPPRVARASQSPDPAIAAAATPAPRVATGDHVEGEGA